MKLDEAQAGLTGEETSVLGRLVEAWNEYCKLPCKDGGDSKDFADGIHRAQYIIAMRVARRANPETWRRPR